MLVGVERVFFYDGLSLTPIYTFYVDGGSNAFYLHIQKLDGYLNRLNAGGVVLEQLDIDMVDFHLPRLDGTISDLMCDIRTFESAYGYFNPGYVPFTRQYPGEEL
jgi:hypothetical protein